MFLSELFDKINGSSFGDTGYFGNIFLLLLYILDTSYNRNVFGGANIGSLHCIFYNFGWFFVWCFFGLYFT
jgi:hypothetical protein